MKKLMLIMTFIVTAMLCSSTFAEEISEDQNPYLWEPKITSVSVFKNGLGFFTRKGQVSLRKTLANQ